VGIALGRAREAYSRRRPVMIVKCEQCQTRFKIPDEKVTDKGVKVRCTKCGNTFRVTADQPRAPAPSAPVASREVDPFAKFGAAAEPGTSDPTRPGVFALGVEATRPPERPPGNAFDFSTLVPPNPPPGAKAPARSDAAAGPPPFHFTAVAPSPAPPAGQSAPPRAFDFAALGPPSAAPGAGQAFDFSAVTAPPPAGAAVQPTPGTAGASSAPAAFDFSGFSAPPPPPVAAPAPAAFDFSSLPPPARSQTSAPMAFDDDPLPASQPSAQAPRTDDFFGAPLTADAPRQLLDLPDDLSDEDAKRALFDLPPPPPEASGPAEVEPPPPAPVSSTPSAVTAASPALPPPDRRRSALGVVVNVLIAAVLVGALVVVGSALLNDGKVTAESLSLEHLKATFMPESDFAVSDISNGLYETQGGRAVFYVRGQVTNLSGASTRVAVQADIVEGSKVVRSARSLAGAVPTPEELFTLGVGEALEKRLEARVAPRAVTLEADASADFLIVFTEYPPDLKDFRVRVVATAEGAATARRP
jgi:predicted Zn finger-like uncharacterized protein